MREMELNAWMIWCASGWFSQLVPRRFQMNATASSLRISTPAVGDEQHLFGHSAEDRGVGVVQIPLEAVEGRPDPLVDVLTPGKAPMAHCGEDLTQRALVGIGHCPVGEEEVETLVFIVSSLGAARPLMLVRGVVEYEVEYQADAMLLELAGQPA